MTNQEQTRLTPSTPEKSVATPGSREPYSTPQLTRYGRFQHLTGQSLRADPEEAVFGDGSTEF